MSIFDLAQFTPSSPGPQSHIRRGMMMLKVLWGSGSTESKNDQIVGEVRTDIYSLRPRSTAIPPRRHGHRVDPTGGSH